MSPLRAAVPSQSPTLPSSGTPGRSGTVHVQNPHSPGAGIGQETAAAPLQRRSCIRQEHDTPQGCPVWELWVIHMDGCCGGVDPNPWGDPYPPHRLYQEGMDCWSVYMLCFGHFVTRKDHVLLRELFIERASVRTALSTQ